MYNVILLFRYFYILPKDYNIHLLRWRFSIFYIIFHFNKTSMLFSLLREPSLSFQENARGHCLENNVDNIIVSNNRTMIEVKFKTEYNST